MKDRIKEIRKSFPQVGKNQKTFANFLGISYDNLASYESGRRTPTDAVIELICEKCSVNKEWLVNGTGERYVSDSSKKYKELLDMLSDVMKRDEDDFKRKFINDYVGNLYKAEDENLLAQIENDTVVDITPILRTCSNCGGNMEVYVQASLTFQQ